MNRFENGDRRHFGRQICVDFLVPISNAPEFDHSQQARIRTIVEVMVPKMATPKITYSN